MNFKKPNNPTATMDASKRKLLLTKISKVTKTPVSKMVTASKSLGEYDFIEYCFEVLQAHNSPTGCPEYTSILEIHFPLSAAHEQFLKIVSMVTIFPFEYLCERASSKGHMFLSSCRMDINQFGNTKGGAA